MQLIVSLSPLNPVFPVHVYDCYGIVTSSIRPQQVAQIETLVFSDLSCRWDKRPPTTNQTPGWLAGSVTEKDPLEAECFGELPPKEAIQARNLNQGLLIPKMAGAAPSGLRKDQEEEGVPQNQRRTSLGLVVLSAPQNPLPVRNQEKRVSVLRLRREPHVYEGSRSLGERYVL